MTHYLDKVMYYIGPIAVGEGPVCGSRGSGTLATDRARVTCKRCLASLAKHDREFQRKARQQFRPDPRHELHVFRGIDNGRADAARAIAREKTEAGTLLGFRQGCEAHAARAIAREEGRSPCGCRAPDPCDVNPCFCEEGRAL